MFCASRYRCSDRGIGHLSCLFLRIRHDPIPLEQKQVLSDSTMVPNKRFHYLYHYISHDDPLSIPVRLQHVRFNYDSFVRTVWNTRFGVSDAIGRQGRYRVSPGSQTTSWIVEKVKQ